MQLQEGLKELGTQLCTSTGRKVSLGKNSHQCELCENCWGHFLKGFDKNAGLRCLEFSLCYNVKSLEVLEIKREFLKMEHFSLNKHTQGV